MRKAWVLIATAALALLVAALPASADTVRTATSGEDVLVAVIDPGSQWVSDTIVHVRGWTGTYRTTDALYGEATTTIVANWNLDSSTGNGSLWGTVAMNFEPLNGGFAGTWTATFRGFAWSGQSVNKGFGDLTGLQQRLEIFSTSPTSDAYTGFVFNPGS